MENFLNKVLNFMEILYKERNMNKDNYVLISSENQSIIDIGTVSNLSERTKMEKTRI